MRDKEKAEAGKMINEQGVSRKKNKKAEEKGKKKRR